MITTEDKTIQSLVDDIREGKLLLPEMQRAYVWDSNQVREFFDSLYHNYPSGQLLVWDTDDLPHIRTLGVTGTAAPHRRPRLLLDGQQRLTSLAAVMLDRQLKVRWRSRPINIVFNVYDPKFEVANASHHPQAGWISLTRLFKDGAASILRDLKLEFGTPEGDAAYERVQSLDNVRNYKYRLDVLEGLSYEEVTRIFVRINSGGSHLSSADLALAQMSSRWQGVTEQFDDYLGTIRKRGWELDYSILLRVLSAFLTNQSRLSQLFRSGRDLGVEDLQAAWKRAQPAMTQAVDFLTHNCLIDRLSMMPTNYVLVPLAIFFDRFGQSVTEQQARDLRRWLYMALIRSRYSGTSETNLDQDIAALVRDNDQPIQRMIQNIEDKVGQRPVTERDLREQLNNSPYMLMAYVLARQAHAQDWFNGVAIGSNQALEYHHIFPKALLKMRYNLRQDSRIINQVANLAFLSAQANGHISSQAPAQYLPAIEPSRLAAQNVPMDSALWTLDQFEEFVLRRRMQLAHELNSLLQSLMDIPSSTWATNSQALLEAHIDTVEDAMRQIIRSRLEQEHGALAWKRGMPGDTRANVEQRIAQRVKQYPYEVDQYTPLEAKLEHCQFSDYAQIISYNWRLFEDVFGQKPKFEQMFTPILNARNALKHHRAMDDSEIKIAEGASEWLERCLRDAIRRDMAASVADETDDAGEAADTAGDEDAEGDVRRIS